MRDIVIGSKDTVLVLVVLYLYFYKKLEMLFNVQ